MISKKAKVWVPAGPADDDVWIGAVVDDVTDKDGGGVELRVCLQANAVESKTIRYANVAEIMLQNPENSYAAVDLCSMCYLNEPTVLHNLRERYKNLKEIYTYCGSVLVAINPYCELECYGVECMDVFRGQDVRNLEPHIYGIAEEAFANLKRYDKNQSVIVSGESGAGKTVSARCVMAYIAGESASVGSPASRNRIEQRVLALNPVMEITGAEVSTYLLEKSRTVRHGVGERSFHVFYQMIAAASSDAPMYQELEDLDLNLGFLPEERVAFFVLLTAVLTLGNIGFTGSPGDPACDVKADTLKHLESAARYLEIDSKEVRTWLTSKQIEARNEVITRGLDREQASSNRDAWAKKIYADLFLWAVGKMNASLKSVTHHSDALRFIGVLDIYGFESFELNSFEQFCINYANEKLQQQFNQHMFKLEQAVYEKEQIEWSFVEFVDNQDCIDAIEGQLGILALLDDECKKMKGADSEFLQRIVDEHCSTRQRAKQKQQGGREVVKKALREPTSFVMAHFAGAVEYDSSGFVEKNSDAVNKQLLALLACSNNEQIKAICAESTAGEEPVVKKPRRGPPPKRKATVAKQFKDSLLDLVSVLSSTEPHYVRCIKPNDEKRAFDLDPFRTVEQLRACGILETVRVLAAGYPARHTFEEFAKRYWIMLSGKECEASAKEITEMLCQRYLDDGSTYQVGLTKVFFRAGAVAALEAAWEQRRLAAATTIQTRVRGWIAKRKYDRKRAAIRIMQAACRAWVVWRWVKFIQMHRASILIQTTWRAFFCRARYQGMRRLAIMLQAALRGNRVRRNLAESRQKQLRYERDVVRVQTCVRSWLARRQLKKLKVEARDVERTRNLNRGLENKIVELQRKLIEANQSLHEATARIAVLEREVAEERRAKEDALSLKQAAEVQAAELKQLAENESNRAREVISQAESLVANNSARGLLDRQDTLITTTPSPTSDSSVTVQRRRSSMFYDQASLRDSGVELPFELERCSLQPLDGLSLGRSRSGQLRQPYYLVMMECSVQKYDDFVAKMIAGQVDEIFESSQSEKFADLSPPLASSLDPVNLTAFLLLLMMRHRDYLRDQHGMEELIRKAQSGFAKGSEKHKSELDYQIMYLGIASKWLQLLRQYNVPHDHAASSATSGMAFTTFDLQEAIRAVQAIVAQLGTLLSKLLYSQMQRLAVNAILTHDGINSPTSGKPPPQWRFSFFARSPPDAYNQLQKELATLTGLLHEHDVDWDLRRQVVGLALHLIAAVCVNQLPARRDFATWNSGLRIKYNLSQLENWCREQGFEKVTEMAFQSVRQMCDLLIINKARKDDSLAASIAEEHCSGLKTWQVVKLLQNFSANTNGTGLAPGLVEGVEAELRRRRKETPGASEPMSIFEELTPLKVPDRHCHIDLTSINVPQSVKLPFLEKVIR